MNGMGRCCGELGNFALLSLPLVEGRLGRNDLLRTGGDAVPKVRGKSYRFLYCDLTCLESPQFFELQSNVSD